jgi:hypothetical protein
MLILRTLSRRDLHGYGNRKQLAVERRKYAKLTVAIARVMGAE